MIDSITEEKRVKKPREVLDQEGMTSTRCLRNTRLKQMDLGKSRDLRREVLTTASKKTSSRRPLLDLENTLMTMDGAKSTMPWEE